MSKIARYNGNLKAFASEALGTERTIFGETTQANDLTSQITADFLRGWGIVGPSDSPALEDFNAVSYTLSQILAYLHQAGVPEYNSAQEYFKGSVTQVGGAIYISLIDANIGNAPASSPSQWAAKVQHGSVRATTSGSLTVPDGVTKLTISGCAAGAGGGACIGGSSQTSGPGSGGGAGQSVIKMTAPVTPGQVIPYTVGAAGVGALNQATPATNGGATTVGAAGSILSLVGGTAGVSGSNSAGVISGPNGGAGYPQGGDAPDSIPGQASSGGIGASGPFGGGGTTARSGSSLGYAGRNADGYGAGGSGAGGYYTPGSGPARAGGNGSPGLLIFEW